MTDAQNSEVISTIVESIFAQNDGDIDPKDFLEGIETEEKDFALEETEKSENS